MIDKIRRWKS